MQKTWSNQNVDISTLTNQIIQFFKGRKFDITALETETGYQIIAGNSLHYKIESDISVTIYGNPENFSINLELCSEKKRGSTFPVMLATMIGGGYFLLKHLKSNEMWMTFKKDFWGYVDSAVTQVRDSASFLNEKKTP